MAWLGLALTRELIILRCRSHKRPVPSNCYDTCTLVLYSWLITDTLPTYQSQVVHQANSRGSIVHNVITNSVITAVMEPLFSHRKQQQPLVSFAWPDTAAAKRSSCDVTLPVEGKCFVRRYCCHLQGRLVVLRMEAVCFSDNLTLSARLDGVKFQTLSVEVKIRRTEASCGVCLQQLGRYRNSAAS